MQKWNEPKGAPPSWLDPRAELGADPETKLSKHLFPVACIEACLHMGCSVLQSAGVTANSLNESAWGQSYMYWNLGGWKITKAYADAFLKQHGRQAPYWAAPGNKAPGATLLDYKGGDPPWCYYRVFASLESYLSEWMSHFVPRPGNGKPPYPGYALCGELFWGNLEWFPELIKVGYKGKNTHDHPGLAIQEHKLLVGSSIIHWIQSRLGVRIDGVWGAESRKYLNLILEAHQIEPQSGPLILSPALLKFVQENTNPIGER